MWSSTDGELKNSLGTVPLKQETSAIFRVHRLQIYPASDPTISIDEGHLRLLTWTVKTEEEAPQRAAEIKMKAAKWL